MSKQRKHSVITENAGTTTTENNTPKRPDRPSPCLTNAQPIDETISHINQRIRELNDPSISDEELLSRLTSTQQ